MSQGKRDVLGVGPLPAYLEEPDPGSPRDSSTWSQETSAQIGRLAAAAARTCSSERMPWPPGHVLLVIDRHFGDWPTRADIGVVSPEKLREFAERFPKGPPFDFAFNRALTVELPPAERWVMVIGTTSRPPWRSIASLLRYAALGPGAEA
jgi:hypothetical protein